MQIENILKMFSSQHLDNFERIGRGKNFPDKKIKDIINLVILYQEKISAIEEKVSTTHLSRDNILKKFYDSSGIEKYVIDIIYSVLSDLAEGTFGHIYHKDCEVNPGVYLSGLYWTIFGKEKYPNNPIISNLYKTLEFMFWKKREKTISEIMDDLEESETEYNDD